MVVYFLRLAAASGIRPLLRTCLLACYVFSMPSVFYFYQTDWASVIVAWSLFPVLVFYLRRAVRDPGADSFWMTAARLGLLAGIWVLNSHPGYLSTLALVLGVYVLVLAPVQPRVYSCLLVASMLATGVAAERIWFALSEMRRFPSVLDAGDAGGLYPRPVCLQAALVPLTGVLPDLRGPFVGIVMLRRRAQHRDEGSAGRATAMCGRAGRPSPPRRR